jgi:predicted nucleic acid-binding protein
LDQPERGERSLDSHRLWEKIKAGEFDVVISNVVEAEIEDCDELKKDTLNGYLNEIDYITVQIDKRTFEVASRFVNLDILKQKSFADCQHIAAAITSGCDIIVSWNFGHIVNLKTMSGVKAVTALEGYDDLLICTPSTIIGGENDDTQ